MGRIRKFNWSVPERKGLITGSLGRYIHGWVGKLKVLVKSPKCDWPVFIDCSRIRTMALQLRTGVKAHMTGEVTLRRHHHHHPPQIWEVILMMSELETGLRSSKLFTCRTLPWLLPVLPLQGKGWQFPRKCHSSCPIISVSRKRKIMATLWILIMPTAFCRSTSREKALTCSSCFP